MTDPSGRPERPSTRSRVASFAKPLLAYPNAKFTALHRHVSAVGSATEAYIDVVVGDATRAMGDARHAIDETSHTVRRTVDEASEIITVAAAATAALELQAERVARRIDDLLEPRDASVVLGWMRADPALGHKFADEIEQIAVEDLPAWLARVANFLSSHLSPAAQAGVWLNHALAPEHREGTVVTGTVNERIVEIPYVFGALAGLRPGSRVLDLGCSESTVALSLASLGHHVTAVDPRGYPFPHPCIEVVATPVEEWTPPAEPFDAIISLSTIEHLGLGVYGLGSAAEEEYDREVLDRLQSWTAPGGILVLTAPYGRRQIDEFQRVYDEPTLARLLSGWKVVDTAFARQADEHTWLTCSGEELADEAEHGVVLCRAENR